MLGDIVLWWIQVALPGWTYGCIAVTKLFVVVLPEFAEETNTQGKTNSNEEL